jgi:hypothetical protein
MNAMMRNIRAALIPSVFAAQILVMSIGSAFALPIANLKVKILAINDFHGQLSGRWSCGACLVSEGCSKTDGAGKHHHCQ